MKFRFAPSPTGRLHVGNLRVALLNWLWAKQSGGHFLLRMDDTDEERSTQEFAEGIERDLTWMGLVWDEFARQSDRMERYDLAAEKLKEGGRLYPCYETAEELDLKRKLALKSGRPPIYDRAALKLSAEEVAAFTAEGRKPHWRFKLNHAPIDWTDSVRGPQHFEGDKLSDPVLIREDGRPLYTLSSCVDDIELGVTHILRGEDHVANTAVQIQLFEALGGAVPQMAHLPLLTGAGGEGLSKRFGSLSLESLRESGLEPMALASYLAKLGTPDPMEPRQDLSSLIEDFNISRFGRATPKFDPEELDLINARLLHEMPYAALGSYPAEAGFEDLGEVFWLAVRGNLTRRGDIAELAQICHGPIAPVIEEADFAAEALACLPPEPWDGETWSAWTAAIKSETGRKGKGLFMPLRLALTGMNHGPELKDLLPLIGAEKVRKRLQGEAA